MNAARYVVAGVARPRSAWFAQVSQWANAAAIPAEFVKCVGVDELRGRITSGRPFSAILLDGGLPGVDRDLLAVARDCGIAAIVVADPVSAPRWQALGASAVLSPALTRAELVDALASLAQLVSTADPTPMFEAAGDRAFPLRGRVIAVTGPGGTGASTVAMSAAQAVSTGVGGQPGNVVLADLCLRAEQGMLHDSQSVAPGLQELVDAHRSGRPSPADIRALCFGVHDRGYDLLLGLRRRRLWTTLRPGAVAAAFEGLCVAYPIVVADVGADLEGEDVSGSIDVEERNVLNRTAIRAADLVLVVGHASLKGLHSLTALIQDIRDFGIDDARIQAVMNAAPASARSRAAFGRALAELLPSLPARHGGGSGAERGPMAAPVFVPVRNIDACLRSATALPAAVVEPIGAAIRHCFEAGGPARPQQEHAWRRIAPGFLRSGALGQGTQ